MSNVGATLVVSFSEEAAQLGGWVTAELDEINNEEKTSFAPGDEAWFWVQHSDDLKIVSVTASSGQIVAEGTATRTITEDVQFVDTESSSLRAIPSGSVSFAWTGNQGTGVKVTGQSVQLTGGFPCIGEATYQADVRLYRLVPPEMTLGADETYEILISVFVGAE